MFKVNIVLTVRYVLQSFLCFSTLARERFADWKFVGKQKCSKTQFLVFLAIWVFFPKVLGRLISIRIIWNDKSVTYICMLNFVSLGS